MVKAIMALYVETKTRVKTVVGVSKDFDIEVGVHQGSILSPLVFIVVMDEVTKKVRNGFSWKLGYADDLVLSATWMLQKGIRGGIENGGKNAGARK